MVSRAESSVFTGRRSRVLGIDCIYSATEGPGTDSVAHRRRRRSVIRGRLKATDVPGLPTLRHADRQVAESGTPIAQPVAAQGEGAEPRVNPDRVFGSPPPMST